MSAASGDLLGIQCVYMPSGFPVAVAPVTPPPVDRHGDIGQRRRPRPSPRRAPTYHQIAVDSRIAFIGRAEAYSLVPLVVDSTIDIVGSALAKGAYVIGDLRHGVLASLAVDAALAVAPASVESMIAFVGEARGMGYNERDVRLVLGLP